MKTTTPKTAADVTLARLQALTEIPFTVAEIADNLTRARKAVQGSGIRGAHDCAVKLERIRKALLAVTDRIDEGTTELVAVHRAAAGKQRRGVR